MPVNIYKLIFAFVLSLILSSTLAAQNTENQKAVQLLGSVDDNNHVILRWAPLNVESWEWGNTNGYDLHRFTLIDENGVPTPSIQLGSTGVILAEGLKPLPEADWDTLSATSDMAGVAAGAIYSDQFQVTTDTSEYSRAYAATKDMENRYGFSLLAADEEFPVAEAMGLGFKDETVISNTTYTYALRLTNTTPTEAQGASVEIEVDGSSINIAPQDLLLIPGDSVMQVIWSYDQEAPYTSYIVERSADAGNTYSQVNDKPIVFAGNNGPEEKLFYSDLLPNNTQTFTYRVKGKTPFGTFGPNSATESAKGIPAPVDAEIKITEGIANENKTNTIVWEFPSELEDEIVGFKITRSTSRNGVFIEISTNQLPVSHRTFSDPTPRTSSYYKVVAVDADDQEVASFAHLVQLADNEPPIAPKGLDGICALTGQVTLTWNDNVEEDLMGYRVYVSNHEEGHYTQVTPKWLRSPIFYYDVDMAVMSDAIFFKTVALDKRENASDFSEPFRVERPDIHPPSPAVISQIEALSDGIHISWIPSSSPDAEIHRLERKLNHTNNWQVILDQSAGGNMDDTNYLDNTATSNKPYNYRIVAEDEAGNKSYSQPKTIIPIGNLIVDGVTDLYGEIFLDQKKVFLSWNANVTPEVYGFDIYRSVDQDTYRHYKSVQTATVYAGNVTDILNNQIGQFVYEDLELISKVRIKYKVQVQMKDGRSSLLSDPVILLRQ